MRKNPLIKTSVAGLYKSKNNNGKIDFIAKIKVNNKIKQRNLTKYYQVVNQAEAKSVLEIFRTEMKSEKVERGDKITLNTFFYETYIVEKSVKIQKEYTSYYECHIKELFGHLALSDIRRKNIQTAINNMYDAKKPNGQNYSDRTVQKYQSIMRNIYNEAITEELIENNPATLLKIKEVNNSRNLHHMVKGDLLNILQLIVKEVDKISNIKYRLVLLTSIFSLRRINEVLQLKYSDLDYNNNSILSNKENKKVKKQSSLFYINEEIMELIKTLKKDNPSDIYIFQSHITKKPYNYTTIHNQHKRIMKNIDIDLYENKNILIHDFRHFFGQIMRPKIDDLLLIKLALDHTDPDITGQYSQYGLDASKRVLNQYHKIVRNITV